MCSFTITNKEIDLNITNFFSQKRGPDHTNIKIINNISFLHNLLHITGEKTIQPLIDDDIVCLLNGEIYNYKDFGNYKSDGECLIPLYKEFGLDFAKKLDGEFAICLINFKTSELILINDTFATKPLWYSFTENQFAIASYESSIRSLGFNNVEKIIGNYAYCIDLKTFEEKETIQLVDFNLVQYKTNYNDWIKAFENSIRKRSTNLNQKIFIGLSAGYDSGAIANELFKQNVNFKAYTIMSEENPSIINQRKDKINHHKSVYLTHLEYNKAQEHLDNNCESFIHEGRYNIKEDKASNGLSHICSLAKEEGYKIYLSGQGADEIISDYGFQGRKIYNHSNFGGLFPNNLENIFPWEGFFKGTQVRYLNKEEYVAGSHGVETRYPFLDTKLVQEFLWLSPELKNKQYKSSIDAYLTKEKYPFERGIKVGFRANSNLK